MPKKKKESKSIDLFKPIDLARIGTPDDPCFGKEYDSRNTDCMNCGDVELCAIAMMQNNKIVRDSLAEKSDFKDLDEANFLDSEDEDKSKRLMKKYSERGYKKEKVKRLLQKRLNIDEERVDKLITKYYNNGYQGHTTRL